MFTKTNKPVARKSSAKRTHLVNELLSTGAYRHDRHGHLLKFADQADTTSLYDDFADGLWMKNQQMYEGYWGPVPWLHPEDFDETLAAWLETDESQECVRGRTLSDLPELECDDVTRQWIYGPSDVAAIKAGFRFCPIRAGKALTFYTTQLVLYEGEYAGKLFRPLAWQTELFCRMHGWVRHSDDWGREIRRFRKAMVFQPKKQGKSPTGAAVGMELTIGESEQGAKTFSAAKDGKQAGIIHSHARQFVKKHDIAHGKANRLGCKVNKSSGEIYHEESESYYRILSGDNIDGQEGLNGSVIIDETHVVDARLANVLEYMGASRPEPLQFEISTAGRDPTGYGKTQFDYGRMVESGEIVDHEVLYMAFGIFDDADVDIDDERTHQRSNPSWFVTIKPSEFQTALERAKTKGKSALDTFLMYRLDKWLSGGSPWLDVADWIACGQPWELADKAGSECVLGVDLSRCRDISAVTATIREGKECWQKTWLWITERYVEQWRERMPQWEMWEASGDVVIVPGDLIDYEAIYERMAEIHSTNKIKGVVYDPTYAVPMLQWMDDQMKTVEQIKFDQNSSTYEGRIDDFEAAVLEKSLIHDGNKCMTWQAGHCETHHNAKGNRILRKPVGKDDPRKIDGMVSSVMSRYAAMALDIKSSVYSRRGVLTI